MLMQNLYHDLITEKAVAGALHLVKQTPIYCFTKRQATVELQLMAVSSWQQELLQIKSLTYA